MRLVHLSDLRFGAHDPLVAAALFRELEAAQPDLVVVTGDLTASGRPGQFGMARELLESAGSPWLCVPGPRDRPLTALRRIPIAWRHSLGDPQPRRDGTDPAEGFDWTAIGIDTSRRLRWYVGVVDNVQRRALRRALGEASAIRVVGMHQSLGSSIVDRVIARAGGLDDFARTLSEGEVDLVLTSGRRRFGLLDLDELPGATGGWHAVVSEAASATATESNGQPQGYNVIDIGRERLRLERRWWAMRRWESHSTFTWSRAADGWKRIGGPDSAI